MKIYLGDGVYASEERGMVKLTTNLDGMPSVMNDWQSGGNTIYLEDSTAINLVDFLKKIGWLNSSAEMGAEYERPKFHIDYEDI